MKRFMALTALILALTLLAGCGAVYTGIRTPMPQISTQLTDTMGSKVGKSTCTSMAWVVLVGDCSIKTAMDDGGITRVHHIDTEITRILAGLYGTVTTVVYGD